MTKTGTIRIVMEKDTGAPGGNRFPSRKAQAEKQLEYAASKLGHRGQYHYVLQKPETFSRNGRRMKPDGFTFRRPAASRPIARFWQLNMIENFSGQGLTELTSSWPAALAVRPDQEVRAG